VMVCMHCVCIRVCIKSSVPLSVSQTVHNLIQEAAGALVE